MIKVSKKKLESSESGSFGRYVKVGKNKGLKILKGTFKTLHCAYNSSVFVDAQFEVEALQRAESSGVVPKCYGIRIVKRGNYFRVGILMQHLGTKRLADVYEVDTCEIYEEIHVALAECGIEHNDLHDYNIMKYRGKFYVIDFGPNGIDYLDDAA